MRIFINDRPFDVMDYYRPRGFTELPPTPTMSVHDIMGRSDRPSDYRLFLDEGGDIIPASYLQRRIPANGGQPDCTAIPLKDGMRFVSIPPAVY